MLSLEFQDFAAAFKVFTELDSALWASNARMSRQLRGKLMRSWKDFNYHKNDEKEEKEQVVSITRVLLSLFSKNSFREGKRFWSMTSDNATGNWVKVTDKALLEEGFMCLSLSELKSPFMAQSGRCRSLHYISQVTKFPKTAKSNPKNHSFRLHNRCFDREIGSDNRNFTSFNLLIRCSTISRLLWARWCRGWESICINRDLFACLIASLKANTLGIDDDLPFNSLQNNNNVKIDSSSGNNPRGP